jgi:transcription termination/antitermination protein NusG
MSEVANPMLHGAEELAWYIVHTRSRHEAKVKSGLEARGLEIFLPRITVRSRRRDRFQLLEMPIFPGYLFVHTGLSSWVYDSIIRHHGVVRILGSKGRCSPLAPETVVSIQSIMESGRIFEPWSRLVPGQQVRVVAGPLSGTIGTIWRCKPGKRGLVVGVELLGRSIAVELEEEGVEPCS